MTNRVVYLLGPETLELRDVPVPSPSAGEIVVRVGAATTCGTDVKVYRRGGHPRMLRVPTPFGHELAGTVAAAGRGVTAFREGDRVVVANSASCGRCEECRRSRENLCRDLLYLNGAFADYLLVPPRFVERSTYPVPAGLPFREAALAEPLACVLHGVEMCSTDEPSDVVIWGGGPIGLLFAGAFAARARRVVVADPNPARLEAARDMGATDTVRVERRGGEAPRLREAAGGDGFDIAIDASGVPAAWKDAIASVRPGGLVNLFGGCARGTTVELDTHLVHYGELTIRGAYHHRPATFRRSLDTLARRELRVDLLISEERPLEDLEGALRSMIEKRALKVVVRP